MPDITNKQAIDRLKTDIYKYADFSENPNENEFWAAFDMAIKALEQESILDKIRAEIRNLDDINPDYPMDRTIHIDRHEVLEIIDKYRNEG